MTYRGPFRSMHAQRARIAASLHSRGRSVRRVCALARVLAVVTLWALIWARCAVPLLPKICLASSLRRGEPAFASNSIKTYSMHKPLEMCSKASGAPIARRHRRRQRAPQPRRHILLSAAIER